MFSWIKRILQGRKTEPIRSKTRSRTTPPTLRRYRPSIELLEDRRVPSTATFSHDYAADPFGRAVTVRFDQEIDVTAPWDRFRFDVNATRPLMRDGSALVADVNGDGVSDLLMIDFYSRVTVYPGVPGNASRFGRGELARYETSSATADPFYSSDSAAMWNSADIGDLNGDGVKELIIGRFIYSLTDTGSALSLQKIHTLSGAGAWDVAPAIGDLNDDGKPDVVLTANYSGGPYVFWNTSNGASIEFSAPQRLFDWKSDGSWEHSVPSNHLALGDMNGDSLLDLVTPAGIYFNTGTATIPSFSAESLTAWNKSGGPSWLARSDQPPRTYVADGDGDGILDVYLSNPSSVLTQVMYFRNTGTSSAHHLSYQGPVTVDSTPADLSNLGEDSPSFSGWGAMTSTADLDNDGHTEIVAVGGRYRNSTIWGVSGSNGGTEFAFQDLYTYPTQSKITYPGSDALLTPPGLVGAWLDANGDHLADFLGYSGFVGAWGEADLYLYARSGSMPFSLAAGVAVKTTAGTQVKVAGTAFVDVDLDGNLDLVTGAADGRLMYYRNTSPNGAFALADPIPLTDASGSPITTGKNSWPVALDLNSDGLQDFLVAGGDGRVRRVLCASPGTTSGYSLSGFLGTDVQVPMNIRHSTKDTALTLAATDVDRDGKTDVVFGEVDGRIWLLHNVGTNSIAEFALKSLDFSRTTAANIELVDSRTVRLYFSIPVSLDARVSFHEIPTDNGVVSGFAVLASAAPTDVTLSSPSIPENAGANAVVGTLAGVDPDAGESFTFALVSGAGGSHNSQFNITGNQLRANASFDFEAGDYDKSVRIRVTDSTGNTFEKSFAITVTNDSEAPTNLTLSSSTTEENAGANAVVGNLTAVDPDAGESFTFTLVLGTGSTDNGQFNITGNQLRASSSFDYEAGTSKSVRIRVTDNAGNTFEKPFAISITNVNEAPTDITLSNNTITENAGMNAIVGTLAGVDPDGGETFAFSLVAGAGSTDNGQFNISGNQLRAIASFDFEAGASKCVRVRVTDNAGNTFEKAFSITITNVDESQSTFQDNFTRPDQPLGSPWIVSLGTYSVLQNRVVGQDAVNIATVTGMSLADVAVQADGVVFAEQGAGLVARYQADGSYYLGMIYGSYQIESDTTEFSAYIFKYTPGAGFTQLNADLEPQFVDFVAGTLRFEVVGSSLKLFGGPDSEHLQLLTYAHDESLPEAGLAGIRSSDQVPIDNFRIDALVPATVDSPFSDTFTQPDSSQLSRNWTERRGHFDVENNALVSDVEIVSMATVNSAPTADSAVQADVKVGKNQVAALFSRYQADGSYYLATVYSFGVEHLVSASIFKFTPGVGHTELAASVDLTPDDFSGDWGTLRFEVVGNSLKLFFGADADHLKLRSFVFDATISQPGLSGLRFFNGASADNFKLAAVSLTMPALPFTDTFTQPDGRQLSRNWTERQGNFHVEGNQLFAKANAISLATVNRTLADAAIQADINVSVNQVAALIARYQDDGSYYLATVYRFEPDEKPSAWLFKFTPGDGFEPLTPTPVELSGGEGTLRFEVVGDSLKLFFNSVSPVLYAFDSSIAQPGLTGLRNYNGSKVDNFNLYSVSLTTPALPFTDTFTQPDDSQLSSNWTERQGNFGLSNGSLTGFDPSPSIATANTLPLADVLVQAAVTIGPNQVAGLITRYQADGSFYLASIYAKSPDSGFSASLFRYNPGVGFTQLNSTVPTIDSGTGTLRFVVTGNSLKLFYGEDPDHLSLLVSAEDSALAAAGLTGIRGNKNVKIDNFIVDQID